MINFVRELSRCVFAIKKRILWLDSLLWRERHIREYLNSLTPTCLILACQCNGVQLCNLVLQKDNNTIITVFINLPRTEVTSVSQHCSSIVQLWSFRCLLLFYNDVVCCVALHKNVTIVIYTVTIIVQLVASRSHTLEKSRRNTGANNIQAEADRCKQAQMDRQTALSTWLTHWTIIFPLPNLSGRLSQNVAMACRLKCTPLSRAIHCNWPRTIETKQWLRQTIRNRTQIILLSVRHSRLWNWTGD